MWICLNKAFLSIVAKGDNKATHLLVRARRAGDIEAVFPGYLSTSIDRSDYQFRAEIPREVVAKVIADNLLDIQYSNFKDSVKDRDLKHAYGDFWHTMAEVQPRRPYSAYSSPARVPRPRSLSIRG